MPCYCFIKIFQKFEKKACIFLKCMVIYRSRRERQQNIRVWRSLVSRLNGVQEASSSNLDTRTEKTEDLGFRSFFFLFLRG